MKAELLPIALSINTCSRNTKSYLRLAYPFTNFLFTWALFIPRSRSINARYRAFGHGIIWSWWLKDFLTSIHLRPLNVCNSRLPWQMYSAKTSGWIPSNHHSPLQTLDTTDAEIGVKLHPFRKIDNTKMRLLTSHIRSKIRQQIESICEQKEEWSKDEFGCICVFLKTQF